MACLYLRHRYLFLFFLNSNDLTSLSVLIPYKSLVYSPTICLLMVSNVKQRIILSVKHTDYNSVVVVYSCRTKC